MLSIPLMFLEKIPVVVSELFIRNVRICFSVGRYEQIDFIKRWFFSTCLEKIQTWNTSNSLFILHLLWFIGTINDPWYESSTALITLTSIFPNYLAYKWKSLVLYSNLQFFFSVRENGDLELFALARQCWPSMISLSN